MLRNIKVERDGQDAESYICIHWKTFPPIGAGQDAEVLRRTKVIDDAQYSRLKLWERVCALMEMAESKCLSCPHRRKVVWKTRGPHIEDPDGVQTPVVDATTGEAAPHNRHFHNIFRRPGTAGSHKPAAWIKNRATGEGDESGG